MSTVEHNFDAIDGEFDALDVLNQQWMETKEELEAEMNGWTAYRHGMAHEAAVTWTRNVANTLDHTATASINYINKGRIANAEMRQQEIINTGGW